jgi:ubiquinone/menaquinone biosynthesis C-methylase UbiE
MKRTLEPEVMDDPAQALAYAEADFDEVNAAFVRETLASMEDPSSIHEVLDLGCGPGDIPIRLADALPGASITGIDASAPMIALGQERISGSPLAGRVHLEVARLPLEPRATAWDLLLSNSLLHHLPEGEILWDEIHRQCVGKGHRTQVRIMDLRRPDSPSAAQAFVDAYSANEPEILRRDFYNSLLAAFTPLEVEAQLAEAGLRTLKVTVPSDRHLLITGVLSG